jgi:hypothetical protein
MDEGSLGVQSNALEVAADGLGIPRRKRGQQVRSMLLRGSGTMDIAAHVPSIRATG